MSSTDIDFGATTGDATTQFQQRLQNAEQYYQKRVNFLQAEAQRLKELETSHNDVIATLKRLPTKVHHKIMVPLGPHAFFPGRIVNTNEVLVLLGDNYFLECTALHAKQIIDRRKAVIAEKAKGVNGEITKLNSTLKSGREFLGELKEVNEEGEEIIEIREEYVSDEDDEVEVVPINKNKKKATLEETESEPAAINERQSSSSISSSNKPSANFKPAIRELAQRPLSNTSNSRPLSTTTTSSSSTFSPPPIVERKSTSTASFPSPPKRVSKFKAARQADDQDWL